MVPQKTVAHEGLCRGTRTHISYRKGNLVEIALEKHMEDYRSPTSSGLYPSNQLPDQNLLSQSLLWISRQLDSLLIYSQA